MFMFCVHKNIPYLQEFETIYKINVSQITSLTVDKLSDVVERIFKKCAKDINKKSIVDEYIAMVEISRKAGGTLNHGRLVLPAEGNSTLISDHLKKPSLSATALPNVPDVYQSEGQNQERFTSITNIHSRSYVPLHNNSVDIMDDYSYQLMENNDVDTNTNHAQFDEK